MTTFDLLLQQTINGLSLGAMYALLALGFTLVYGILELINFSHFNVFMVGSFVALFVLQSFGLSGQAKVPTIQGVVSFDANGDLLDRTVSVFQIKKDASKSLSDITAQAKYIAVAPQS